jgi:PEP-CTERM motif-containing protein
VRLTAFAAFFCLAPAAWGSLIGTSVTGSLQFDGNPDNFFDPANGFVPARFDNSAGPTVAIDGSSVEFGYNDGANRDTANFTDGTLVIRDRATSGGSLKIKLAFTDEAFADISLVSSTFRKPIKYSIDGDQIDITIPKFARNGNYRAVFDVTSTPEPGSVGLMGLGLAALVWASRKFRKG